MKAVTSGIFLVPLGVILSASAQIVLKRSSGLENWSRNWILLFLSSGILYLASMVVYLFILRLFPISRIYPVMTVLVIVIISIYGHFAGESISVRHIAGICLGVGAVYLLMSG